MIAKYVRSKLKMLLAEDVERISLYESHSDPQMMASPALLSVMHYPITLSALVEYIIALFPRLQPNYELLLIARFRMTPKRLQKIAKYHARRARLHQKVEYLEHKKKVLLRKLNQQLLDHPSMNKFVALSDVHENADFNAMIDLREHVAHTQRSLAQSQNELVRHISDEQFKSQSIYITPIDMR